MSAIQVDALTKSWGKTRAVDGINFDVEKSDVFGFLGSKDLNQLSDTSD